MGRNYPKRIILCVTGLMLYGLGSFFGVIAGSAGTNAWSTLSLGVAGRLGVSYGTGNVIISILVLGVDLLCKGKLGPGSVLNAFLVSAFSDFFINTFTFFPPAESMALGVMVLISGMPAGSTTAILADKYDGDSAFASCMVFVSTVASMLTLPLLCLML